MDDNEDPTLHFIIIGMLICIILIIIVSITMDAMHPECFVNKSEDGYYWETDTTSFVSQNDKQIAINALLKKLKKIGIEDITSQQLNTLHDGPILDLLDLDYDNGLTTSDVATLRMYINPNYYLASVYVNEARSLGDKFADTAKRALVYSIITQYYKLSSEPTEIASLSDIADTDIIKEFNIVKERKTLLEYGGYASIDMDKVNQQSIAYAKSTPINSSSKMFISNTTVPSVEVVTPVITPPTTQL